MASTPQLLAAVLAFGVIGVGGGYAAGVITEPSIPGASGQPAPLAGSAGEGVPTPKQSARTVSTTPDDTRRLDPDIVYRRKTFEVRAAFRSEVSLHVPADWWQSEPRDDREQFTDPLRKRWIRIESGFTPLRSPNDSRAAQIARLLDAEPPNPNLKLDDSRPDETREGRDGRPRSISTLVYTYAPKSSTTNAYVTRLVLTRWIAFGEGGNTEVELSVTGLPQDAKALEKILDRATDTVTRRDL
jgi:hypothetical protein